MKINISMVVLLVVGLMDFSASAATTNRYLYMGNQGAGKIQRVMIETGEVEDLATVSDPKNLVVDTENECIFWCNNSYDANGGVYRAKLNGTAKLIYGTASSSMYGLAFNPTNQLLYVANGSLDLIFRIDYNGGSKSNVWVYPGTARPLPNSLSIDLAGGRFFWNLNIAVTDPVWNDATYWAPLGSDLYNDATIQQDFGSHRVSSMVYNPDDDKLYFCRAGTRGIYRANASAPANSGKETLLTTGDTYQGIAVDTIGDKIYYYNLTSNSIDRIDLDGGNREVFLSLEVGDNVGDLFVADVVVTKLTNSPCLYVANRGADMIQRIWLDRDGTVENLAPCVSPSDIVVDTENGYVFWSELDDATPYAKRGVWRMELDGSDVTQFYNASWLNGVVLDPDNLHVYVADASVDLIYRIDYNGGSRSNVWVYPGTARPSPTAMSIDFDTGRFFWNLGNAVTDPVWNDATYYASLGSDLYNEATLQQDFGLQRVNSMVYNSDDDKLYFCRSGTRGIYRANASGTANGGQDTLVATSDTYQGITVDTVKDKVYYYNLTGNSIDRIDLDGGNRESVQSLSIGDDISALEMVYLIPPPKGTLIIIK